MNDYTINDAPNGAHDKPAHIRECTDVNNGSPMLTPEDYDHNFMQGLAHDKPCRKACDWVKDQTVSLYRAAFNDSNWYLGQTTTRPVTMLSELTNPNRNDDDCSRTANHRMRYHAEQIGRYRHGQVPLIYAIDMIKAVNILFALLLSINHHPAIINAVDKWNDYVQLWNYSGPEKYSHEEFMTLLKQRCEDYLAALVGVWQSFLELENRLFGNPTAVNTSDVQSMIASDGNLTRAAIATEGNATRQEVKADTKKLTLKQNVTLASVAKVGEIVKRIDDRDKRYKNKSRAKFDRATLDKIWTLWETGKRNPEIKYGINTKVGYEAVFNYYRSEFVALGVKNADMLRKAIKTRGDQIRREKAAASKK